MRNPRVLFWFIIVLTIVAVLVVLPKTITVANKTFKGFDPSSWPKPFRIEKDFSFRRGLDLEGERK
jgi:hypothetical protein